MDASWTGYVRDVFIILAAAAVLLVSAYLALVGWHLYRLASEVGVDLKPILTSAQRSAKTVETTTAFLAERSTTPLTAASSSALGLFGLLQLYRQFRLDQRAAQLAATGDTAAPVEPPPATPTAG